MSEAKQVLAEKKVITPLWIVALFVSLTEVVLGIAVIQTQGGIQIALTVFVLAFPVLIAGMFFAILWYRPYVFYPPTEFGEQTNVRDFVDAMSRKPSLDNEMYQNIQEVIRATLTSGSIVSELTSAVSGGNDIKVERKVERILDSATNSAVNKIREVGFITIDSTPLLKEKGSIWHEPYSSQEPVSAFSDILYFKLKPEIPPFAYGSRWILRDKETGKIFTDIGCRYPNDKLLAEAGIHAGMTLQVISPDARTKEIISAKC